MLEIIKAIILGIVQGITEWLPVSSTGHMILVNEFLPMQLSEEFVNLFLVIIQLGSIMAVVVLYFSKLNPFSFKKDREEKKNTWILWGKVLVASVPAAIVGLLFDDVIDELLYNPVTVALALIIYGILFIAIENRKVKPQVKTSGQMTFGKALGIGCYQMLALIPGTSRSGSTILGASLLGCARPVAAEFSFFMAIPVMFGASALKLLKYVLKVGLHFSALELGVLFAGCVVAFAVSLLVIKGLMAFVRNHSFRIFGWYRIILGNVILAYFLLFR